MNYIKSEMNFAQDHGGRVDCIPHKWFTENEPLECPLQMTNINLQDNHEISVFIRELMARQMCSKMPRPQM